MSAFTAGRGPLVCKVRPAPRGIAAEGAAIPDERLTKIKASRERVGQPESYGQ